MKKAVLLDVSAMMYRAFYAHMNFRTKGEPTGAIFGFTNTLLAVIDEFKPDYIGAAFDVKRKTLKRSERYEGYKADRKPMPDDLRTQIPRIEEVLDGFGVEKYKVEGHEADDVLGTLAKKLSAEGVEVYIITGDKDLSQVLDENVNIALLGKGEGGSRFKVLSTEEDVKEQLGVGPKDIPDLFGLIGDASDGIPGVRKVGVKKAVPMLEKYGNLEGIYENIDKLVELPGVGKGLIKNIEEDKEMAFLSRELATIDLDVPLEYSLEDMAHGIENDSLFSLFKTLEFRVLIKKLKLKEVKGGAEEAKEVRKAPVKQSNNLQFNLFDGMAGKVQVEESAPQVVISEVKDSRDVLKENSLTELNVALDGVSEIIETIRSHAPEKTFDDIISLLNIVKGSRNSLKNIASELNINSKEDSVKETLETEEEIEEAASEVGALVVVKCLEEFENLKEAARREGIASIIYTGAGFALSLRGREFYIPVDHQYPGAFNLTRNEVNDFFKEDIKFISYKFKDILKAGYEFKDIHFDTMIAYYLLTAYTKEEVDTLIYNETGEELETYKEIFGKEEIAQIDVDRAGEFYTKRSRGIYDLTKELKERLEEDGLTKLYYEMEMPLMPILAQMEMTGIAIDPEYFSVFGCELKEKLVKLKESIFELAEEEFNLNSPKQLGEILFMKLNIDTAGVKKTKTGYSTNVDVLEFLRDRGEKIAEYILEYRKLAKLSSTYVEALPKLVDSENRLHTTFNQTGTATGRLSSSNPNLQNIPVKSNEGIKIRQGFIARDGYTLLALDYSQIELRVLAEISKDDNLLMAYRDNIDLHDLTARRLFELGDDIEVSREQRTMAKIVNFSIIYGKTAFGLAKELSITRDEAKDYIAKYFAQYPKVKELEEAIVADAEEKGYVRTLYGRKRSVDGITASNKNIKSQAERMAVNTVIQGTAADILKKVMIEVAKVIEGKDDITLNLQVHDELIFEVRDEVAEKYAKLIKKIMESSISFDHVKLEANVASGKNWAEAK